MNNKEAIRRKKLYYDGLERAISQPIPKEYAEELESFIKDENTFDEAKMTLTFWKEMVAPLDVAIAFIHDNRMLPQGKDVIVNDDSQPPFMLPNEIFATLRSLILPAAGELLSVLSVSSGEMKGLLDKVEHDDLEGFVSLLEKTGCDTTPLAKLCACCMDDVMDGFAMTDEERSFAFDHIVGTVDREDNANDKPVREAAAQLQPYIEHPEELDTPESSRQFYSDYLDFLVNQLTAELHYYWDYYDSFTLKERNLIEPIFGHPLAVELVNQIWDEYRANLVYSLPDDFFNSKCDADDTEHLHIKLSVEDKGAVLFTEFINYVAEKGYIENAPSVKTLFAYRLTGYGRPEKGELPVIVWNGKNNKSYELIYIIRHLCDRGDYKKMRRFFEGCEWVKEKDSSYAVSADSEFKRKMSELYPDTCPFK